MESLYRVAHRRLYPSVTDPSYLVLLSRRLIFADWVRQLRGEDLAILDIGGRVGPYRPLFGVRARRYVAVDLIPTDFVSVVADGQMLPFAGETFDVVIATQVLEYLPDPHGAANQIHSVLKPGGVLLASTPAYAPRFGEEEYWRFTPSGLRSLLAPFATIEIVPELSSVGSLIRTINLALDTFARYPSVRFLYRRTACPLLNLIGLGMEKAKLTANDQFAANYSVRAVKAAR